MRLRLYATIEKRTMSILHRIMEERECNRSEAIDFIAKYYHERMRENQMDEVADRVVEKLQKKHQRFVK